MSGPTTVKVSRRYQIAVPAVVGSETHPTASGTRRRIR